MEIIVRHTGEVELNGKITFDNEPLFIDVKNRLRGKKFELVLREKPTEISKEQYGYFFGVVLKIAHGTNQYDWMDKSEDLHEKVFAPKFLSYQKAVRTVKGDIKMKTMVRSLTDLTQKEMSEYITRVRADLDMDGIITLDPDQVEIPKRYRTINTKEQ